MKQNWNMMDEVSFRADLHTVQFQKVGMSILVDAKI